MNEFAMHDAAREGDLERLRQLIEAGVPVDSVNKKGQTPLHLAALCGRYKVAELLIDSKCNINPKDRYGSTPVMIAAQLDHFGSKDIVDLLFHRGAEVNFVDDFGCTLLHRASAFGWTEIARRILEKGETDINAVDHHGDTPLMCATIEKNEEVALLLIQAGADINRSDNRKTTALHCAVQSDHTRMIHILLEKEGLHLSPQDDAGNTPLHRACWQYEYRKKAIKQLLDSGANINVKNNQGETALNISIRRGNMTHKEIRFFVQKGAYLKNCDYEVISRNPLLKHNVRKDMELCTTSVVNKFNHQSLPALNSIAYFAKRLPNVDNFKLKAQHIDEVKNLVQCEIERNTFCNVVKVHPIALSVLCVLSLITCQPGKKRAASPDFGHSSFKKINN